MAKNTSDVLGLIARLPKPTSLTFNYPKEWADTATGFAGALSTGDFLGAGATVLTNVASKFFTDSAAAAASDAFGVQINQRNKSIFRDLPFRQVAFAWSIMPLTVEDAKTVEIFLKDVKKESAPTLMKGDALFGYPNLFELEIRSTAGPMFKSDSLALTNLTMDFTPSGFWSQHKDGRPTKMNFSMEFTEIRLATRENLESEQLV